jgi:transposase
MTHAQKFERRRLMAEAVRGGKLPDEVAREFRVSLQLVHLACREHAVEVDAVRQVNRTAPAA